MMLRSRDLLAAGTIILIAADGLDDVVRHRLAETFGDAVEILVGEARRRARGTGDNISIAVLKLDALPVAA